MPLLHVQYDIQAISESKDIYHNHVHNIQALRYSMNDYLLSIQKRSLTCTKDVKTYAVTLNYFNAFHHYY